MEHRCTYCPEEAVEGTNLCPTHGGGNAIIKRNRQNLYEFNKSEYMKQMARRVKTMESSPEFTSVKTELGILRIVLERLLSRIESDEELLLRQGEIIQLVEKIEKLTKTVREAEKELGNLLGIDQAKELVAKLLSVIVTNTDELKNKIEDTKNTLRPYMTDPEQLDIQLSPDIFIKYLEKVSDGFGDALRN